MDKKKILVVDDTDWNRDLLVQLLEENYAVLEAVDGEQGVKATEQEKPDLILMDLGMPVMDGWEATRRIKADPETAGIPIIALTASAFESDREKSFAAGCCDFDTKPVDLPRLLGKIERSLALV